MTLARCQRMMQKLKLFEMIKAPRQICRRDRLVDLELWHFLCDSRLRYNRNQHQVSLAVSNPSCCRTYWTLAISLFANNCCRTSTTRHHVLVCLLSYGLLVPFAFAESSGWNTASKGRDTPRALQGLDTTLGKFISTFSSCMALG